VGEGVVENIIINKANKRGAAYQASNLAKAALHSRRPPRAAPRMRIATRQQ